MSRFDPSEGPRRAGPERPDDEPSAAEITGRRGLPVHDEEPDDDPDATVVLRPARAASGVRPASGEPKAPARRASGTSTPRPLRKRLAAWIPTQHGAWAMLLVPLVAGAILRVRGSGWSWHLATLAVFWLAGYACFFAASMWLKAHPAKRGVFVRPAVVYAAVAALAGVATLLLGGVGMAWWVPLYAPLLGVALWLAWRGRERSVLGGILTVAAAALMLLVAALENPARLLDHASEPLIVACVGVFGYFVGTVLYVKTMIRKRGVAAWQLASLTWHTVCTVGYAALVIAGLAPRWWPVFFLAATVRAWWMARAAARQPIRPARVGAIEMVFALALLVLVATS